MKKLKLKIISISCLLLLAITVHAANPDPAVIANFQKLYPNVTDVTWAQKGGYEIACFMLNGFERNAWFTKKGEWKMTETDFKSLNIIPKPVAQAFWKSTMAAMATQYIRIVTLPDNQPEVIVIDVQAWNSPEEFQLFYSPDGKLLETLNATETGGEIYPDLFD